MIGRSAAHDDVNKRAELWWFVAICAAALVAYARSFGSPFQFDDFVNIVEAKALRQGGLEAFFQFARARIVPSFTLMVNYRLGREDPFGYHVVNFIIHVLATLAVYRLVLALCRTPRLQGTWIAPHRLPLAIAAAVVFACHPIQIQAVTYIVQRMSSMVTLFYIASVFFYVHARNAQLGTEDGRPLLAYAASALMALAAFLSKENSASLPLMILLTEFTFYPAADGTRRLLRLSPFLALVLVIPLAWWIIGTRYGGAAVEGVPVADQVRHLVRLLFIRARPVGQISPDQYFLTQCLVLPQYLGLVLLPWGFNVDHDVPVATGLTFPVMLGVGFLITLFATGIYALRRAPLIGFGIVWFFLALSVESSFLPIQDAMVEHRMYLAMPGVALALAVPFLWALVRWRTATVVAGAIITAILCTLTIMRNEVWRTHLSLWQDAVAKSPNKARGYVNVGTALQRAGDVDEAIANYCKALALDPKNKQAESNLNAALAVQLDKKAAKGMVMLDAEIGPDGRLTVSPKHPCPPAGR